MTFKAFIFGLLGTFGLPWLAVVVLPYSAMRSMEPVEYEDGAEQSGVFIPTRDGRITEGSKIYGQEGCYQCHTQVIRPTYAGNDVHRDEWAGLRMSSSVDADTRRETIPADYNQEEVAHVGNTRIGPDLSNFGRRLTHYLKVNKSEFTPEEWVLRHFHKPAETPGYLDGTRAYDSACPPKNGFFKEIEVYGAGGTAFPSGLGDGKAFKATDRARALASYLLSLKKDTLGNPLPAALNFNPATPDTDK